MVARGAPDLERLQVWDSGDLWGSKARTVIIDKQRLQPTPSTAQHHAYYHLRRQHPPAGAPDHTNVIGARLSDDIAPGQVNYGHLQVAFADGSVGWYEAGLGPMMSETAFFVKDVIGPRGCVSIVARSAGAAGKSSDVDSHTRTEYLKLHNAAVGPDGAFARQDEVIDVNDEPGHDELCRREQEIFLRAIREDQDLSAHWQAAIDSLRIVLAADQSFREGRTISL